MITFYIPSTVIYIGTYVLNGCTSLASLTSDLATPLTISSNTFTGIPFESAILYVPEGKTSIYTSTSVWNSFTTINEPTVLGAASNTKKNAVKIVVNK